MNNILNSTGHNVIYKNFVNAENSILFDTEGNSYLDFESGVWCTSLGHCHPEVTRVITEQASRMIHSGYCYLNPLINDVAENILRITGINSGKCVFLCSGSEAVEYAVKMVPHISDRPYLLSLKNSYLSAYGSSGDRAGTNWVEFDWMQNQQVDSIDFKQISAFVFEPGSASGLVHFPPENVISEIVKRVREEGGLIVVNEVTTGMGRTGSWFGYNHYDIAPDIVALGKGLGNGYPVSCTVVSGKILQKYDIKDFHYSQSHQNDPLGAAVVNKVIEVIQEEGLIKRSKVLGNEMIKRLTELKDKYGFIEDIRGKGLMLAVEFEESHTSSYAEIIKSELLKRNIIVAKRPGYEALRIDPALTVKNEDIEYFFCSLEEVLKGMLERQGKV